ncbi:neuronal acetylcholine receptor subunit alpha-10 isoform X1 [Hydra vulgaris]|uniref:neuronal acetylcholine receptor subunit alpha-10 isoform X1 n=1 Tax=Hydra vulgaris TaxID=6087 RepID=UPI000641516E|nr:neuronal acetylcholine receptor subunit alpha-10 [Hydra vulgaris]
MVDIKKLKYVASILMFILVAGKKPVTRPEVELLNVLFRNYNYDALPTEPGKPVNLTFDLAIRQVLDMDEKSQILEVSSWIRHYWNDPYLTWNSSEWEGITNIAVTPDKIWKPDITLYNNAEREFQGLDQFGKTKVTVYSDGRVVWLIPKILRSACKLEMTYFPFDNQVCSLTFGSWAYDQTNVDLFPRRPKGDLSYLSKNGEFIIDGFEVRRTSEMFNCCPNPYVTLSYYISLHRRAKFYLFNLIIPGALIAILSCFSFFLPPLTGERAGLVITNFLSLSVYVLIVSDSVPPSSDTVPLLVKFYTVLMCEIGLALMSNCVIIMVAAKTVPVPNIVRVIFFNNHIHNCVEYMKNRFFSKLKTKQNFNRTIFIDVKDDPENDTKRKEPKNTFIMIKERLFNARMTVCNDKVSNTEKKPLHPIVERTTSQQSNLRPEYEMHSNIGKEDQNSLNNINHFFATNTMEQKIRQDWEHVVRKIDQIFFVLFMVLITLSVIIIFSAAPNIHF